MNPIYIRDVLFDMMLYMDDFTLRRLRVTNNQINLMIDDILQDPYFWAIKQEKEQKIPVGHLSKQLRREHRFNRQFYDAYETESEDEEIIEDLDDTYLDTYILPPRQNSKYIYNQPILTKEQLDEELNY
jgi:hypothetical protein